MPYVKQRQTAGNQFTGSSSPNGGRVDFAGELGDDVAFPRLVLCSLSTGGSTIPSVKLALVPDNPAGADDEVPLVEWTPTRPRSGFLICSTPVPRDLLQTDGGIGEYHLELRTSVLPAAATWVVWWAHGRTTT